MKIRIVVLLIGLMAFPVLAQQVDRSPDAVALAREAQMKSRARGAKINSNSEEYQVLLSVRAAKRLSHEQPEQTLARMSGNNLIETKGSFVVFDAPQQSHASVTTVNGASSYPTVLNARTGGIGVIPGTIDVKLKNIDSASVVAADHGLDVVRIFKHLNTAFYRVKSGQDVVAAATSLGRDTRVENAEVEIIEHVYVPN